MIDTSNIKRDFLKIDQQQRAKKNVPGQKNENIFGKNNNSHQIDNAYIQYNITIRKVALPAAGRDPPNLLDFLILKTFMLIDRSVMFSLLLLEKIG